jgi:hypothetical protein
MLQKHVNPEEMVEAAKRSLVERQAAHVHSTAFAARYSTNQVPKVSESITVH